MKDQKLPRGIRRRADSLIVCFALADGTIERRSLGMVSIGFAEEQLGIFKRQVREGTYKKRQPRPEAAQEVTCADLWDAYRKDCQNRDKRVDRLETAWTHLALPFAQKPGAVVRTADMVAYIAERRAAKITNGTINRELAVLKAAFRYGARSEMVSRIPMFPKRLKEARPRQGFVDDEQYKVLAANARDLWLRTFLALGYNFGFRKGELLALRVRNIDLLDGRLTAEMSKNGEGRRIALTQETKTLLCECVRGKQPDDFVLTRPDGSRVAQPRKDWYALCVRCGLGKLDEAGRYEGLQMHDLRRSAVRRLVRSGVPEKICMAISGHKTRSVFDRYNITNERDLENAAKLLEAGASLPEPGTKTDTKTDTSVFAHS